jgi:hypothetical protein
MSQVFGGVAGGAKALGGLPKQNQASRQQAEASRNAQAEQQYKQDQMSDYYNARKGIASPLEANRAMMQMEASRATASLEDTKPSGAATNGTGAVNGSAALGGNGVAANGAPNGALPATKFSAADLTPTNGASSGAGTTSTGSDSVFRSVDRSAAPAASSVGGFSGAGEGKALEASPSGQSNGPSAQALPAAPVPPTLFSEGAEIGAALFAASTPGAAAPKALPTPPAKSGATGGSSDKAGGSAVTGKPLRAVSGNAPGNPLESEQLQKGIQDAQKIADKIPETAIGISAESLHAKSRDDSAALPPANAAQQPQAPKPAGATAPALASARPSVAAMAQRSKPLPDLPPPAKPLEGKPSE